MNNPENAMYGLTLQEEYFIYYISKMSMSGRWMITKFTLLLNTNQVNAKDPPENERSRATAALQAEIRRTALFVVCEPAKRPIPLPKVFWIE